jgi:hypothetical protein
MFVRSTKPLQASFSKIGAAEVRRDDHLPVGAWPHVLAGAIKKRAVVLLPCLLLFERK